MNKFDKDKTYADSLKLSQTKYFYFIQDIIDYLACGKTTFYTLFPDGSDELNTLKENLFRNRVVKKVALRQKFEEGSDMAKLVLYKLICSDEERKALSMNYFDETPKGDKIIFEFGGTSLSMDELERKEEIKEIDTKNDKKE
jgi:hypothetical protein